MPLFPYDKEIGGGWGLFKITIPEFKECFEYHDAGYDELIAGTSLITLKQLDRYFLANMLRKAGAAAWLNKDLALGVNLTRKAWLCYRLCRIWAKTVRAELEAFRPQK